VTRRPDYADRDGYYASVADETDSPPSSGWRPRWWNRLACWCNNRLQIIRIWQKLNELENRMSSAEQEQYDRGAQLVGLLKAEFASLHTQLTAALEDSDAKVATALGADSAADAERIKGLLDELATVLPGEVPDVPVPDPGQPAEVPADGGGIGSVPDEPAEG
jgi:hypothetical protein